MVEQPPVGDQKRGILHAGVPVFSRGFGFVEMPNEEEGQKAIDQLNGTSFEGQTITVNVARPREERSSGGYGGNRGGGYGGNRGGGYGGNGGGYGRNRY